MELSLIQKINNKLYKGVFKPRLKKEPTLYENRNIGSLRNCINKLKISESDLATETWIKFQQELVNDINTKDPRFFLNWKVIRDSMNYNAKPVELEELRRSNAWPQIKNALIEDPIGAPDSYYFYPKSSGNLIHHAYTLLKLQENFGINIYSQIKSVFEFGGGYGSVCRYLFKLGFNGEYIIYDFPIFNCLQEYYLKSVLKEKVTFDASVNVGTKGSVRLLNAGNLEESKANIVDPDLFIAMWSLSESPLEVRELILRKIGYPKYVIIAYQEYFENINNVEYFSNFFQKVPYSNYEWKDIDIPHIRNSRYLIGKRIS